jgi:fucose permease
MHLLSALMIAVLLLTGMGAALLGSIKLPLAARLRIDEARVGGLVSLFGFIMIPVIFAAGFLTDLLGRHVVLGSGSALLALSLALLAAARTYPLALLATVLLSGGWSLLVNVGNVLTPHAFPGSLSYATNLANVFFGLGAMLTPLGVAFLVRRSSLATALALLTGLALVPALLSSGADLTTVAASVGAAATSAPIHELDLSGLLADPLLWLCGLALFCYGPLEASLAAWSTTYLTERGVQAERAATLLSGFWLAFMAARLATAFSLSAGQEAVLILVLALLCVAVLLSMALCRRASTAMALVLAAGLVFGPVFPTLMAILLGHFPPAVHGRAVGLLFAIGGMGWTVIPLLIGAYARRTGLQRGLFIAVAAAVGLCLVALVLVVRVTAPGA